MAMSVGETKRWVDPVTSRKASSTEMGWMAGENRSRISKTCLETLEYVPCEPLTKMAFGQSRLAIDEGIAEWHPKARAS